MRTPDVNAPLDAMHAQCARALAIIGEDAAIIRHNIATWEPRPAPARPLPRTCPNCLTRFGSHALLSEHARFGNCRREVTP